MPTRSRVVLFALPALLVAVQWTFATPGNASARPEIGPPPRAAAAFLQPVRVGDARVQQALSHAAAWKGFESRYGRWNVMWNEATRTPHRAFGPSIPLTGFANDPASADRAVRAFIAGHPDLFGGPGITLESVSASQHGNVWYVRFRQTVGGIPVLFSDWEFRVGTNGRLMMFGADPRAVPTTLERSPLVVAAAAREAAHQGLDFDPARDRVDLAHDLAYVPVTLPGGGADLRLAYEATVRSSRPGHSERVLVDAGRGGVLYRQNLRADAVTGLVTATIHPSDPNDTPVARPLSGAKVAAGAVNVTTITPGTYSIDATSYPTTITSSFTGPYCNVQRMDSPSPNSSFSKSAVANNTVQNVAWTTSNSQASERDAFYHTNLSHDWIKAMDPTFTAIDYSLTVNVNWNDGTDCEAYWEQLSNSLNYWLAGATCPNTATIPDLIWHEYSHMVDYNLYYSRGASAGLQNGALGEGLADAFTVLLGFDPLVGNGFNGPGTFIRDVRVAGRYPENASSDPHGTGVILAGALWDLADATNATLTSRLMHYAKYGLPDDPDDGVAFSEFFIDVMVADDNDADLSNGTPNLTAINTSFSRHGIGLNYFLSVAHEPLADQPSNGPYPINATITYGGPIGGLGSSTMYYSINKTPFLAQPMLPTGNPDEYGAEVPATSYGVVRYYLATTDVYGGTVVQPPGAPTSAVYTFVAGPASTLVFDNMEANDSWTVSTGTPAATSGTWIRAVPVESSAQTGIDHTAAGTQCWVTGNAAVGDPPGTNDVDDGQMLLTTTTFNAAPAGIVNPIVSYWRCYSNDIGDSPNEDPWKAYISNNNGSTWARVENSITTTNGWQRVVFAVKDYVTPTSTMKMRFVAQDTLNPSIVEAAVDDWSLMGFSGTLDVPAPLGSAEFAMQPAWPNPATAETHVRFSLATAGRVELCVYDLEGRRIRTLVDGEQPPGTQSIGWDGRDQSGHRVASGPYFLRLTRGKQMVSRAVVMMR